jgi:LysM repeat protein
MQALRQLISGALLALVSTLLVVGGLVLSLSESELPQAQAAVSPSTATPLTSIALAVTPFSTTLPENLNTLPTLPIIPSTIPTETATLIPPTNCPPPLGWYPIVLQSGDTLDILASRYHTSSAALMQANCLLSPSLLPGYNLYVPPAPTNTAIPCGAPYGWIQHIVQPGENLYRIGLAYGVSTAQLQQANCLVGVTIYSGQRLWVPNVPTRTPAITNTPSRTPTFQPTATFTQPVPTTSVPTWTTIPPTATYTQTPVPPSATPVTPSATQTPLPTNTFTPVPTTGTP